MKKSAGKKIMVIILALLICSTAITAFAAGNCTTISGNNLNSLLGGCNQLSGVISKAQELAGSNTGCQNKTSVCNNTSTSNAQPNCNTTASGLKPASTGCANSSGLNDLLKNCINGNCNVSSDSNCFKILVNGKTVTVNKPSCGSTAGKPAGSTTGNTTGSTAGKPAGSTTGNTTGSTAGKPAGSTTGSTADTQYQSYVNEVVKIVNQERAKNGLGALTLNAQLSKVAQEKSRDMAVNNYFSHTSPTYGSPFDMMKSFGIKYTAAGENIAYGYRTPAEVMDGWMNSPGHRANILNSNYTQIGVGVYKNANGTIYWTQEFTRP